MRQLLRLQLQQRPTNCFGFSTCDYSSSEAQLEELSGLLLYEFLDDGVAAAAVAAVVADGDDVVVVYVNGCDYPKFGSRSSLRVS